MHLDEVSEYPATPEIHLWSLPQQLNSVQHTHTCITHKNIYIYIIDIIIVIVATSVIIILIIKHCAGHILDFLFLLVGGLEHFLFFHKVGNNNPNFHIFQRGRYTTKQDLLAKLGECSLQ
jgi:hypothetical protein